MEFAIIWSSAAKADLADIHEYLLAQNPQAAVRIPEDILLHVETLRTFPHIGPKVGADASGESRWIACEDYRIVYRVDAEHHSIEVIALWHGSREAPPER